MKRPLDKRKAEGQEHEATITLRDPPNLFARHATILESQHAQLSETCAALEAELKDLWSDVVEAEQTLRKEYEQVDSDNSNYRGSIARTINQVKQDKAYQPLLFTKDNELETYLIKDNELTVHLEDSISCWQVQLETEMDEQADIQRQQAIDDTLSKHVQTELLRIKAEAQCTGQKAKNQVLERELEKLNRLPKFLQVLKATAKENRDATKTLEEKLPLDSIQLLLTSISDTKLRPLLDRDQAQKDNAILNQYVAALDGVYDTLVRQRACQQLLTYCYDIDLERQREQKHRLEALFEFLSEEEKGHEKTDKMVQAPLEEETELESLIESLLTSTGMDFAVRAQDSTLVAKIKALFSFEEEWKQRWSDDLDKSIAIVKLLEETQDKAADNLFNPNISTSYTELRDELEYRSHELKETVKTLEQNNSVDELFQRKRRLFSLFYSDPTAFEEHVASTHP